MAQDSQTQDRVGWVEVIGLSQIIRTLGMAIHPSKLMLALFALILTFGWGSLLDLLWSTQGGVHSTVIDEFILSQQLAVPFEERDGTSGLFDIWRHYEQRCVEGVLAAAIPPGLSAGLAWHSATNLFYGTWWLARHHIVFFLLLSIGSLLIWSLFGGAICRMAAMEFAREEKPSIKQALAFSRKNFFGGFFLAPCVPLAFIAVMMVLLMLGGMVLRVPVFGDLVSGGAFFLAILGGLVITILFVGLLVGGSLFWPTVASEGSDAFDAFSRGLSYTLSKPWKTVVYAVLTVVYAAVCWFLAKLFLFGALSVTRAVVAIGTSWFGLWNRQTEAGPISKLELLWPVAGSGISYQAPAWSQLAWYEYFSAFAITMYVLLMVGLLWAFLCSFYFSGSTVIYFLLRRDVDGTDLEEVYDEERWDESAPQTASTQPVTQPASPASTAASQPAAPPPGKSESSTGESESSPSESKSSPSESKSPLDKSESSPSSSDTSTKPD